jgi:hypothetical protein
VKIARASWGIGVALSLVAGSAAGVSVTSPTVVVTHQDLLDKVGPSNWHVDSPISTFTHGGIRYWFHTNSRDASFPPGYETQHQKLRGSLDAPFGVTVWNRTTPEIFCNLPAFCTLPPSPYELWWIVNTYQHADGLLAFIHVEGASETHNRGRLGLAWSTDGGEHFRYLGHIVIPFADPTSPNLPDPSDPAGTGFNPEGVAYLVANGYFYAYYKDYHGIAAIRAPVDAVIAAANLGTVSEWKKYYVGGPTPGWNSPALGGPFTGINIEDGITHTDAAYSTYDGKYYMLMTRENGVPASGLHSTYVKLYDSTDAVNWQLTSTLVEQAPGAVVDGYQYASIVDASGSDNGVVGSKFYVYCAKESWVWQNDVFYRWTVDLAPTPDFYRFSSNFSSVQGTSQWFYQYMNGVPVNMAWSTANSWWQPSGSVLPILWHGGGHPGEGTADGVIKWVVPKTATAEITTVVADANPTGFAPNAPDPGNVCGGADGVQVSAFRNGTSLWSNTINHGDTAGKNLTLTQSLNAGDALYFVLNKGANPTCDSTVLDPTIRLLPSWTESTGFSSTQGLNQWHYKSHAGGTYANLTWSAANSRWQGTEPLPFIGPTYLHPGASSDAVLMWTAPSTGWVRVTGTIKDADGSCGDGIKFRVLKNSTVVRDWSTIANGDSVGTWMDFPVPINAGDVVYFIVNKNGSQHCDGTTWDPTVRYATTASANFATVQGHAQWQYQYRDIATGAYYPMTWNAPSSRWEGTEPFPLLGPTYLHPGSNSDAVLTWVANSAGTVRLFGIVKDADAACGDGVSARIIKNGLGIWGPYNLPNSPVLYLDHDFTTNVVPGDTIDFVVNKGGNTFCDGTTWDPVLWYQ